MERGTYLAKTKRTKQNETKSKGQPKAQQDMVYKIFSGHANFPGASAGPAGPAGPIGLYAFLHLLWLHHPKCLLFLQLLAWSFTPEMY